MKPLALELVAKWTDGKLVGGQAERHIARVSTDTRELLPGDLFVALRGENFDGHQFIEQAIQKGAVAALVDKLPQGLNVPTGFAFVQVTDTLLGLQLLAKHYRQSLTVKVVAVTGSNGKTSTKEFIAAVLEKRFKVLKTTGNLNNHIGVPLTVLSLNDSHEYAVVEMGMNHPGELAPLIEIAKPEIGVITTAGWAHIEAFASREAIAAEKARVIECLPAKGLAILNGDNPQLLQVAPLTKAKKVTVGTGSQCTYQICAKEILPDGTKFLFKTAHAEVEIKLSLAGWHMAQNASLAVALGVELGLDLNAIQTALATVQLPKGRLAIKKFRKGYLLDDTYNANPDSVSAALQTLAQFPGAGRRVALLGSMGELGKLAEKLHLEIGAEAVKHGFDLLLAYGEMAAAMVTGANQAGLKATAIFTDHKTLAQAYWQQAQADDKILVKGSRSQHMEHVVQELERLETACCIS